MIPTDMVLVRTADLVALLNVAIDRGEKLEYYEADDDYRQWLAEISASMTPPAQQVDEADTACIICGQVGPPGIGGECLRCYSSD